MKFFCGEDLGDTPYIVVLGSGKIGNFIVSTPLLRGLKEKYPRAIVDFLGGDVTLDFEVSYPYIDERFSLHSGTTDIYQAIQFLEQRVKKLGKINLLINLDYFNSLNSDLFMRLKAEYYVGRGNFINQANWNASDVLRYQIIFDDKWNFITDNQEYSEIIRTGHISEIFCKVALVETDYLQYHIPYIIPNITVPSIIIYPESSRMAKLWPIQYWEKVVRFCLSNGYSIGIVGQRTSRAGISEYQSQMNDWINSNPAILDLRDTTSLRELAGIIRSTKLMITVDTGLLHMACGLGTRTLCIVGSTKEGMGASPSNLWLPQLSTVEFVNTDYQCPTCFENRYKNSNCLLDKHYCMEFLLPSKVQDQIKRMLFN